MARPEAGQVIISEDAACELTSGELHAAIDQHLVNVKLVPSPGQVQHGGPTCHARLVSEFCSKRGVPFLVITERDPLYTLVKLVNDNLRKAG